VTSAVHMAVDELFTRIIAMLTAQCLISS